MKLKTFHPKREYRRKVQIQCPNCHALHTILADDWNGTGVMHCESDDQVCCEKPFAYEYAVAWAVQTFVIVKPEPGDIQP